MLAFTPSLGVRPPSLRAGPDCSLSHEQMVVNTRPGLTRVSRQSATARANTLRSPESPGLIEGCRHHPPAPRSGYSHRRADHAEMKSRRSGTGPAPGLSSVLGQGTSEGSRASNLFRVAIRRLHPVSDIQRAFPNPAVLGDQNGCPLTFQSAEPSAGALQRPRDRLRRPARLLDRARLSGAARGKQTWPVVPVHI